MNTSLRPLDIINDLFLHLQTCYGTTSPVWEDAFTFFIKDPHKQNIDIQVSHPQKQLNSLIKLAAESLGIAIHLIPKNLPIAYLSICLNSNLMYFL